VETGDVGKKIKSLAGVGNLLIQGRVGKKFLRDRVSKYDEDKNKEGG